MERKSPFKRAKTIPEEKKADIVVPHKSIKHQHAARSDPRLAAQFQPPRQAEPIDEEIEESQVDAFDELEDLPQTQPVVDDDDDEELADESSDDEGDFRSLAHDVIQKNGYRTVQKWFDLEAEPFKPKRKIVLTTK